MFPVALWLSLPMTLFLFMLPDCHAGAFKKRKSQETGVGRKLSAIGRIKNREAQEYEVAAAEFLHIPLDNSSSTLGAC